MFKKTNHPGGTAQKRSSAAFSPSCSQIAVIVWSTVADSLPCPVNFVQSGDAHHIEHLFFQAAEYQGDPRRSGARPGDE